MIRSPRRGALVPAVLAAMVVIGFAASAALYVGRAERAMSADALLQTSVASALDEAEVVGRATLAPVSSRLAPGQGIAESVPVSNAHVRATARLVRLGMSTFALMTEARADDAAGRIARRRSSLVLRLRPPTVDFPAALTLTTSASAPPGIANGADHPLPYGDCQPDSVEAVDVLHPFAGQRDSAELAGMRQRASLRLGQAALVGLPGPVVRNGECDTAVASNWGDPARTTECGGWLPVIHAPGDVRIVGGAGQGVLLVDGDLEVSGGFEFAGAVIVAGTLSIGPGGTVLRGGVRAGAVVDASGIPGSTPFIVRSSCALRAALLAAGRLVPAADRPWDAGR